MVLLSAHATLIIPNFLCKLVTPLQISLIDVRRHFRRRVYLAHRVEEVAVLVLDLLALPQSLFLTTSRTCACSATHYVQFEYQLLPLVQRQVL